MTAKIETTADVQVRECLDRRQSFALIAGAGSGKTSSLVEALERIRAKEGPQLRQNGQRIACITFTKRAVEVIKARLGFDELYLVSTLHSFLWGQISRFQESIREALTLHRLPALMEKERGKDNGGKSKAVLEARERLARLAHELASLPTVGKFEYSDAPGSDYSRGQLSHDDIIEIATYLFQNNETFRRITGLRFPYLLVDEAQDTFPGIVSGFNLVCSENGLPLVGYFGDPWQQIYEGSAGEFIPPNHGQTITKTENFRCSKSVIRLLNAFRTDVEQHAAGLNRECEGSVVFRLVQAERPDMPRNRYSDEQVSRALERMDQALTDWDWQGRDDVVKLFLVRQMIARRMGFTDLNRLFTGAYASSRAERAFESGEHFLLLPITATIYPLIAAHVANDNRKIVDLLRRDSPAFSVNGPNAAKSLRSMIDASVDLVKQLKNLWDTGTLGDILRFSADKQIIRLSEHLRAQLVREPRTETFDEALHVLDKGDWLADELLKMRPTEIPSYHSFISNNTAFSTQHGVKGEEYAKVLVVYDDVEANWNNYSFSKILTPGTAGTPTDGQLERGKKLAYVSFSRALTDLRVLLFAFDPTAARQELIDRQLVSPEQIEIVS